MRATLFSRHSHAHEAHVEYFAVFGERHLRHILTEYVEHFNHERPHQALGNRPPAGHDPPAATADPTAGVVCRPRLGGLLRHYRRRAA